MLDELRRRRAGTCRSTLFLASASAAAIALCGCGSQGATASHGRDTASTAVATTPAASATPKASPTPKRSAKPKPPKTPTCSGRQRVPLTIRDLPNDVEHLDSDGDPINPRGPHPKTDLLWVVVTNGCTNVRIVEHIADLQPGGYQQFDLGIRTPQRNRSYYVSAVLPRVRDKRGMQVPLGWDALNRYSTVIRSPCPGKSAHADFARNVVTFVVPISCLGRPAWVNINAANTDGDPNYDDYEDMLEPPAMRPDGWSARAYR